MLLKFCVLTKWEVRIKPLHHTAQHRDVVWRKSISAVELKHTIFTPKNGKLGLLRFEYWSCGSQGACQPEHFAQ